LQDTIMFRELTRLIEAASELAGQATAAGGSAIVDVQTRVAQLRREARRTTIPHDAREPARGPAPDVTIDVFNEEAYYVIVAELRGVDRSSVQWHVKDDRVLVIRAESARRKYYREIQFAAPVDPRSATASFDNGILELRLWKQ
jgi:HSP20 family protein